MEETGKLILEVIQAGGVVFIIAYLIWGLRLRIKGLEDTVKTQKETLDSMKLRNEDLERITKTYRGLIESYPQIKTIFEDKNKALMEELKRAKTDLEQKENELKRAQTQKEQSKNDLEQIQGFLTQIKSQKSFATHWLESLDSEAIHLWNL
jgi:chromosome segregation ATPase